MRIMKGVMLAAFLLPLVVNAQREIKQVIHFDTDRFKLDVQAQSKLDKLIKQISKEDVLAVSLSGHTDSDASDAYNERLAANRSASVLAYLAANGVNPDKIEASSFGEANPTASNMNEMGKRRNRRVVISVSLAPEVIPEPQVEIVVEEPAPVGIKRDTFYGAQGTRVIVEEGTFAKDARVEIEMEEIFDVQSMLAKQVLTQDHQGNCLVSAGMVLFTVKVNGREVDPVGRKQMVVQIPVVNGSYDPEMNIYEVNSEESEFKDWRLTDIKQEKITDDKTTDDYYQYRTRVLSGVNLDKLMALGGALRKNGDLKTSRTKDAQVFLVFPNTNSVLKCDRAGRKRYWFPGCIPDPKDAQVVVLGKFKEQDVEGAREIPKTRYSRLRQKYIFKRKYFKRTPKESMKILEAVSERSDQLAAR